MTSVYSDGARKAKIEYMKFVGVSISVPTDEQIAARRVESEKYKPKGAFKVEWEPMSYTIQGGKYGNTVAKYLDFTFPLDDDEQINQVREFGWRGAGNINKRMSIPASLAQCKDPWTRFMVMAQKAGLDLTIGENGSITSKDVGTVFEVEDGVVVLPTRIQDPGTGKWRDSNPDKGERAWTPFMILPVKKVTDYVQPDDVPVRFIGSSDDSEPTTAATTTGGTTSGVSPEQLASAFAEAGLIGASTSDFPTAASQINVTNKFGSRAPVLFAKEVQDAAASGSLFVYAMAKGAINIDGETIVKVA